MSFATFTPLAADSSDGMHLPTIDEFFPPAILFEGTPFEITRLSVIRVLVCIIVFVIFFAVYRRMKLVPGRGQSVAEMALDFVRVQVAEATLSPADARRYLPLLSTMFFSILALNITGIVPFMNISTNSLIAVPLIMAIVAYVGFIAAGIQSHGALGYLKAAVAPSGVAWYMLIILAPIEFFSTFVIRPVTLIIRLMANMIAGHFLLVVFSSMTTYLLISAAPALKALSVLSFAGFFAFTLFEILVAGLQAYIFSLLTAVYINLSKSEH